jgi:hypothetical protein
MRPPVRAALEPTSALMEQVVDGLGALERAHRVYLHETIRASFGDSLDLDEAMRPLFPNQNRWDYLLGYTPARRIVALEPHSAHEDQISVIIEKKKAAQEQLRGHLKKNAVVAEWFWVASGKVQFAKTEKAIRRLDEHGILFVSRNLLAKHLAHLGRGDASRRAARR